MRYGLASLALVLVAGLLYGIHTKAVRDAEARGVAKATIECIQAIDRAIDNAEKQRKKVEYRNAKLAPSDARNNLFSNWMRGKD